MPEWLVMMLRHFVDPEVDEVVVNGPANFLLQRGGCLERVSSPIGPRVDFARELQIFVLQGQEVCAGAINFRWIFVMFVEDFLCAVGVAARDADGVAGAEFKAVAINTEGFRFANLTDWKDARFLPGAIKYGDMPTLLSLSAPNKLWIGGEKNVPAIAASVYKAAAAADAVTYSDSLNATSAAIDWILQQP